MNIKRYLDSGYIDIKSILDFAKKNGVAFLFLVGGRGCGKTYSTLQHMIDTDTKFIYMRRKQSQADLINKEAFSPFKAINANRKTPIITDAVTKYSSGFYYSVYDSEKQKYVADGDAIGYTCALSTIANMRGFDVTDCDYLIYDEFIPEKHEGKIKNEGLAFLNAYETIARNRELQEREPLRVLCLANAFDMGNAIYETLGLIDIVDRMEQSGYLYHLDKKRGILILSFEDSTISERKADTALYRAARGTEYYDMAIGNKFVFEEKTNIKNFPLKEFTLYVSVAGLHIYRHKSMNLYYVTDTKQGSTKQVYGGTDIEIIRYKQECPDVWDSYIFNTLYFDRYAVELRFKSLYRR